MAKAPELALGLNHPSQLHGTTANEHVEEVSYATSPDKSDEDTLPGSRHGLAEDLEKRPQLEPIRSRTTHPLERTESGVDVARAQEEFAALGKELSVQSRLVSRQNSKASVRQRKYSKTHAPDVEKALSSSDSSQEPWDLETVLRGDRQADQEAGIKSKRIGVIWDKLTVKGIGGVKVSTVLLNPCWLTPGRNLDCSRSLLTRIIRTMSRSSPTLSSTSSMCRAPSWAFLALGRKAANLTS